jgi:DNA-binding beta-propeller fold protein YncE
MKLKIFILLCVVLLTLLLSCKRDKGYQPQGDFPPEISRILSYKCATSGCHNDASYQGASGLNLSTWDNMFKGGSSGSAVIPYQSRFSTLFTFVNTFPDLGNTNTPTMPLNGKALSREEVERLQTWIDAGAPNTNGQIKFSDNPNRKKLYAVNQGCDVVTVFDAETRLPMRYISVGTNPSVIESPHMVRVSPDGKYWYVVFLNNSVIQKYRCSDDAFIGQSNLFTSNQPVSTINKDWNTFVITNDGKKAFCVSYNASGQVAAVDLENLKCIRVQGGFNVPHGIALNAAQDKVYLTRQVGNYMYVSDTAFSNPSILSLENGVAPSPTPKLDPHEIVLAPNQNDLLITCQKSNEVRIFSISQNSVTQVINTAIYPQEIITYQNKAYISCPYDSATVVGAHGLIQRLDLTNYSIQTVKTGFQPHGIAISTGDNTLYALSRNLLVQGPAPHHSGVCAGRNGFVTFIDLNTFTEQKKRIEVSVDPYFISARP